MSIFNKFIVLLFFTFFSCMLGVEERDLSGYRNVIKVMLEEDGGIASYDRHNVKNAQTLSLFKDLDMEHIVHYFPCKTQIGKYFITKTLSEPVTSECKDSVVLPRQKIVQILTTNPAIKKEVDQLLEEAKKHEQNVFNLMSDLFKMKSCPQLNDLKEVKKYTGVKYYLMRCFVQNPLIPHSAVLGGALFGGASAWGTYVGCTKGLENDRLENFKMTASLGLVSFMISAALYNAYQEYSTCRSMIYSLYRLVYISEALEKIYTQYELKPQFKISEVSDKNIFHKLKHQRYKKEKSLFFYPPFVHNFLYNLYTAEKDFASIYALLAESDAYNAIATKIIESQGMANEFCFVDFVDSGKPCIRAQSFWNVLVKDAVPSSITEDKQIILTGPNAGGKTTAIRALLQNVVFAQTFGIAAAKTWSHSMFDVIHSYMNISDDLLNGLSLFASEVKRAQEILQCIKTLGADKKFFFALDELFTGTAAEDGEKCAYKFVKRLATFERTQFIYATHFDKLKELGDAQEHCRNYKVDAPTKDNNGKFIFPYTISQGASNVKIGLELAQQANLFN